MTNYWTATLKYRVSRRRALAATGATAAAAAFLAACGGSSKDNKGSSGGSASTGGSNLLGKPNDQTGSPQKGGTLIGATATKFTTWDPMAIPAVPFKRDYNELFYLKAGKLEPGKGEIGGDLADSWEFSPDRLTLTVKLSNKAHFAPTAPVNGREVDSDDILFSWDRVKAQGLYRADLSNDVNPAAPILSVNAPDAKSVQLKFNAPLAGLLYLFASQGAMTMPIVPKEAADQKALDLRSQVAGTGIWNRAEVQEDVKFVWKRNAGFGQDPRGALPYPDEEDWIVIPEYGAALAQFKTGTVHMFAVNAEDIIPTKKDVPTLEMLATKLVTTPRYVIVGAGADSPFRDERVRQAYSMSWDRDLFINTTYNVDKYAAEGLPMETRWSSALQAESWTGWWLDPKGKDFGDNSKFFQNNIPDAKKLLSAAGHTDSLNFNSAVPGGHPYGPTYDRDIEIVTGMAQNAGFNATISQPQFGTEFRKIYSQGNGDFSGLSYVNLFSAGVDPSTWLFRYFNSQGSTFYGFDADGSGAHKGDPMLDQMTNKMRLEVDDTKRMQLGYDIQRYVAEKMYFIAFPGGGNGFELAWPAVRNRMVYVDDVARPVGVTSTGNGAVWLDQTKPPFKPA
ncbi:MAG TPA: ABC transporter substrate-binding protein [Dehalococcoidia bacterium]|nr:ABC transporter substrate-binding protein [Dehalococcoidia bacterium]